MTKLKPIISLKDLSKIYSSNGAVAVGLHKINLDFYKGEFVAVTGSSGSGKSTLLNVISCIDSYEEGELLLFGEETAHYSETERAAYRKDYVAFIFQDYNIIDSYTVYQNVELALLSKHPDKKIRRQAINDLLAKVGLLSHANHRATKLSGGQKQRVSIARALAKDAPILFADEPTGNLDSKTSAEILALLKELSKDKLVVVVTHSYDEIKEYATRKIRLADGEIAEDTTLDKNIRVDFEKRINGKDETKKQIKAISTVAKNNILATPKRSIFSLTGLIIVALAFIWLIIGITILNTDDGFYNYDHKLDIQVTTLEDRALDETDIETIKSIEDVVTVKYYIGLINQLATYHLEDIEEDVQGIIRPASAFDNTLYSGRLPENDTEIVINLPAKRKYTSLNILNKVVSFHIQGIMHNFVVVGTTANGDSSIFVKDEYIPDTPEVGLNSDRALVAVVNGTQNVKNTMQALEDMGYRTYYLYSGSKILQIEQIRIVMFSVLVLFIMLFVFRAVQGSVKTVSESKKRDYNIMRTVGLSNNFIKLVYYFEMAFIAIAAWIITNILSFIGIIVYTLIISPSILYAFSLMRDNIGIYILVTFIALAILLFVTLSNAVRFNKKFYKYTVKNSLLEG